MRRSTKIKRREVSEWPGDRDVSDLLDRYVDWRETAGVVAAAYTAWRDAPRGEQEQRYWAYRAVLEQEACAAAHYAAAVGQVSALRANDSSFERGRRRPL